MTRVRAWIHRRYDLDKTADVFLLTALMLLVSNLTDEWSAPRVMLFAFLLRILSGMARSEARRHDREQTR